MQKLLPSLLVGCKSMSMKPLTCLRTCVLVVSALTGQTVFGQELCNGERSRADVRSDQKHISELIAGRNFDLLETEFSNRQRLLIAGHYSEEDLYFAFENFDNGDIGLDPIVTEWQQRFPKSVAALTARGIVEWSLGRRTRGQEFRKDTSETQMEGMRRWMTKARKHLEQARALDNRWLPPYAYGIRVEMFIGNRAGVDALYRQGLVVAPGSVYLRKAYMLAIDRRWGGSNSDVTDYLLAVQDGDLPQKTKQAVQYEGLRQLAATAETYDESELATRLLRKAAPLCRRSDTWADLAERYNKSKQWTDELDVLDRYLGYEPNSPWALRRKAYAFRKLGNWDQAIPLFRKSAEAGDAYAQNAYGFYLLDGAHLPQDLKESIVWLERAAAQGNKNALANLRRAHEMLNQKAP